MIFLQSIESTDTQHHSFQSWRVTKWNVMIESENWHIADCQKGYIKHSAQTTSSQTTSPQHFGDLKKTSGCTVPFFLSDMHKLRNSLTWIF